MGVSTQDTFEFINARFDIYNFTVKDRLLSARAWLIYSI